MKILIYETAISFQACKCPDVLYEMVVEVDERVVLQQKSCHLNFNYDTSEGSTGEKV